MKVVSFFIITFMMASCNQKPEKSDQHTTYFDIAGYFKKEAGRLQSAHAQVDKTVSKNMETEQKRITIQSWTGELSLFAGSDINKPAWKNSYRIQDNTTTLQYESLQPDLKTKKITIVKDGDAIKRISVLNGTNNSLYTSSEQLDYFPDSLYRIVKKQKVIFIGAHNYVITGRILK